MMAKNTWRDQFTNSVQRYCDEELPLIIEDFEPGGGTTNDNKTDQGLCISGWNAVAHQVVNRTNSYLENLTEVVRSPIEQAMLYAIVYLSYDYVEDTKFCVSGWTFGGEGYGLATLVIEPQAQIGEYRVDFLITLEDREEFLMNKNSKPHLKIKKDYIIIECDGHDFHEKTKEQAAKDKKRDRELQKLGYPVFRYTGSEICCLLRRRST